MALFTRLPTRKLFRQYNPEGTLDLEDWHKTFIDICDPTEYAAAIALVGSWPEWLRFKKEWVEFREIILPAWLMEVEIKLRSNAIKKLVKQSETSSGAAQWLAESKYKPVGKGRPTKAEVERQAKIEAGVMQEVEEDIARVKGITH